MVLESFLTISDARKNTWSLFFLGIICSSVSILLSLIVFKNDASMFSIFLTTIAITPLFVSLLKDEEEATIEFKGETIPVFRNHLNVLSVFFFLFLGFTISFSLWFSFLPDWALNSVFSEQLNDLRVIRSTVSGYFTFNEELFLLILQNNLRVLFFVLLFSFVYGSGAVIILAWNASVLGAAVGVFIREKMTHSLSSNIAVYLSTLPLGLGQYMFHGVFEIMSYFMASVVGGIASAAVIRKSYKSRNVLKLLRSITLLITGAIIFLVIAAYIEVSF